MFWWFRHYHNEQQFRAIIARQDHIIGLLQYVIKQWEQHAMNIIDQLEKAVENQTDVHEAIEQLIKNIVEQVKGAGPDRARLEKVLHSITANTDRLADLVLEHTEAEDEEDEEEIPPQVLEPDETPAPGGGTGQV